MAVSPLPLPAAPPVPMLRLHRSASSVAVAPDGNFAVVATRDRSRVALQSVPLPWSGPTAPSIVVASYVSKWDVTGLAVRSDNVAAAINLKALVWSASNWDTTPFALAGHSRAITGIDWSAHEGALLATSSMDAYVHVWDVGRSAPNKPVASFCAWQRACTRSLEMPANEKHRGRRCREVERTDAARRRIGARRPSAVMGPSRASFMTLFLYLLPLSLV